MTMMTEIGGIVNFLMVIGDLWGFWPSKMGMCVCVSENGSHTPRSIKHRNGKPRIFPEASIYRHLITEGYPTK